MKKVEKKLLWFGLMALVSTFLFSYIPTAFSLLGNHFRPVDFVSDIKKGATQSILTLAQKKDSLPIIPVEVSKPNFITYPNIINYETGHTQPLEKFVKALKDLKQSKRSKVRIAYLGDSFIEGDLITMDLRQMLQNTFGGSGVGFVPITSITAGFRQTITHSFSSNWNDFSFKSDGDRSRVFISGHNYTATQNSSVNFKAVSQPLLNEFGKVFALYKSPNGVPININNSTVQLPATNVINQQLVATKVQNINASFSPSDDTFYGFCFEPDTGIVVDNFSFRGISGIEFQQIAPSFLEEINRVHPYDLVVFQYGPNLLFKPNLDNFNFYLKPMVKAVQQFKTAFAQADILLISTGDKAFRYNGAYQTAKGVLPLLQTQQQIAAATAINFWNLYLNMGGEGSMIKWVDGPEKLANKDYTHVNFRGGKRIAELLFNTIMNAFKTNK